MKRIAVLFMWLMLILPNYYDTNPQDRRYVLKYLPTQILIKSYVTIPERPCVKYITIDGKEGIVCGDFQIKGD